METLCAQLEESFELDELMRLGEDLLGFSPDEVGGTSRVGSFARALAKHCVEHQAVEALRDAVVARKPTLKDRFSELSIETLAPFHLEAGDRFGPFTIFQSIGRGPTGSVHRVQFGDRDLRLKVLRRSCESSPRGLMRFLTFSRLCKGLESPATPKNLGIGNVDGRYYIVSDYFDGLPLEPLIQKTGPLHVNDAASIIRQLFEALDQFHGAALTHGNLKPSNVLVERLDHGRTRLMLVDAGTDKLETRAPDNGRVDVLRVASPVTAAPEVWGGEPLAPSSDVYAAGVLVYLILTGKLPFSGASPLDLMLAHLTEIPDPPSEVAPEGWVNAALDDYLNRLLSRSKDDRPRDARAALDAFEHLMMARSQRPPATAELLEERIGKLLDDPMNAGYALALEAVADDAASSRRVAETFMDAFDALENAPGHREAKLNLAFRAGRLYRQAGDKELALEVYARLLQLEPTDKVALAASEDLRRQLERHDELVEMWLARAESAEDFAEKASAMAKIGGLYDTVLADPQQALVAYTQAFCYAPDRSEYTRSIERLAKGDPAAWGEVLASCEETVSSHGPEDQALLLLAMGRWYTDKVSRYDLALGVYQSILSNDAANEAAMEGMTHIYRRAQQWPELVDSLKRHAAMAETPGHSRELRCEAAEILLTKLGQAPAAEHLFESVLDEDPTHRGASDGLARLYEASGDFSRYVSLLERRADAARGSERANLLSRVGEIQEDRLHALDQALSSYQRVLAEDPSHLGALRGVDRVLTKEGRYAELLANLEEQVRLAATPRQKLTLLGRIASLYEEEFLDPSRAISTYRNMLAVDERHDGALSSLERLHVQQKQWHSAVEIYERHAELESEPKRKADLLMSRARIVHKELQTLDLAIQAYGAVLDYAPDSEEALSALAQLKESAGDADEALAAIEALAETSHDAQVKADNYVKASAILEGRGDVLGAIDRYRLALRAVPDHAPATDGLVRALVARNDVRAAAELLTDAIDHARHASRRAKLSADLARLALERLEDHEMAIAAANAALEADRSSAAALFVLGEVHIAQGEFGKATQVLEPLMSLLEQLERDDAVVAVFRYIDALSELGSTQAALAYVETARRLAPDDAEVLRRVAEIVFEHGDPAQARNLYTELLDRFEDELTADERFLATYRRGEATLRTGQVDMAVLLLEEACDLEPGSTLPLASLADAYAARQQWERVWEIRSRLLDLLEGDERVEALVSLGELASEKLDDKHRALKSFVAALDERPGDRKLLARLMQLYSEEKDWSHVVEVVMQLVEFQEDPAQKAKYLMTAGMLNARELGEFDAALDCFRQVMELDPSQQKAFDQTVEIHRNRGEFDQLERLLKTKMKAASAAKDRDTLLRMFDALGELYRELGRVDDGVDALEAAQTLDPDNTARPELLVQLYATNPQKFFDKARAFHERRLHADPYRAESYKALRKLYTEMKNADGAWCLCQALYALNLAAPDEERFFVRMRSTDPAYAQTVLGDEDWALLMHPDLDPYLTAVFAVIEPSVIEGRGQAPEQLGYDPYAVLNLATHPLQISQTLFYAAGVMNQEPPPCFENANDPGGLVFLPTNPPACSIGAGLTRSNVGPQPLAYLAGQHLTYYRPGFALRQLVATGTGLKSWLFAAIKLMSPQFPVAADVETAVQEALGVLRERLAQPSKDELARAVSKLLQSKTALDLKRWVNAVDLTADRVGFLLAHDLETAMEVVRAAEEGERAQRRLKELVLFAISQPYLTLRARLQIDLQA